MQANDVLGEFIARCRECGAITLHLDLREGGLRVFADARRTFAFDETLPHDEGVRVMDFLRSSVVQEGEPGPLSFAGHLDINGTPAAVASFPHAQGFSAVMHLGRNSIFEIDLYMRDRARILHEAYERFPADGSEERRQRFDEEILDAFDATNDLSGFDLTSFAAERNFNISPRPAYAFEFDESTTRAVFKRVGRSENSLMEWRVAEEAVILELAREARREIADGTDDARLLDAKIDALQGKAEQRRTHETRAAQVAAGVGQDPFDEKTFLMHLRMLETACDDYVLGGNAETLSALKFAISDFSHLIPGARSPRKDLGEKFADEVGYLSREPAMTVPRIALKDLLNSAEDAAIDTRGSRKERAAARCVEILREAYRETKRSILGR